MMGSFSGVASGNIAPSRFVTKSASSGEPVLAQAGANADCYGISAPYVRRIALSGLDDGYAAIAGSQLNVIGPGDDEALLALGGTVTAGQLIKSDADGKGVAATANLDRARARAKRNGVAGDLIPVQPLIFDISIA